MQLPAETLPLAEGAELDLVEGRHVVRYRIGLPYFGFLFAPLIRRRARQVEAAADAGLPLPSDVPWWAPPVPMTSDSAAGVAAICLLSLLAGYGGGLLTQTLPYAAKVYGVDDLTLGRGLALVRVGVVLALLLGPLADRHGRRRFVLVAAVGHCFAAGAIALAPTFASYIGGHVALRCLDTSIGIGLAVLAAETVPAGDRAFVVSLVTLAGGLGVAGAVVLLPLAAHGRAGLSAVYVVQLGALPFIAKAGPRLVESPRYLAHAREPHRFRELLRPGIRGRLALVGGALFLFDLFLAPSAEFANRYLDQVRGFSSSRIVVFLAVTSIPFLPFLLWGARAADRKGRKVVGVPSALAGTITFACVFLFGQPWMWVFAFAGTALVAPSAAAFGPYGPELFPTRVRAGANAAVNVMGVTGSALGLLAAGQLARSLGIGRAVAVLAVFPLLGVLVIALLFPETARRELEDTSGESAA